MLQRLSVASLAICFDLLTRTSAIIRVTEYCDYAAAASYAYKAYMIPSSVDKKDFFAAIDPEVNHVTSAHSLQRKKLSR